MPPAITTRRATADDIDAIIDHVQRGLDSYVEFAPSGWRPPQAAEWRDASADLLDDPRTWSLLALADGHSVGHVSFYPARERSGEPHGELLARPLIPGLAHFWQLFVMPPWWGRGVAALLHDHAIAEMRVRGYERSRLFTPAPHARARRFYERRGWSLAGEEWHDGFQMVLCEYRLGLGS